MLVFFHAQLVEDLAQPQPPGGKNLMCVRNRYSMNQSFSEDSTPCVLQEEIDMLRIAMQQAFQIIQAIEDPSDKLRGLNTLSSAAGRVASLVKTQHQLGGGKESEIARAIQAAIAEAARKLKVEL